MGGQAGNGFAGGMGTSGPMGGGNAQSTMRRQQFMQGGGRVPGNDPQWGPMGGNPMSAPQMGGMQAGSPPQSMFGGGFQSQQPAGGITNLMQAENAARGGMSAEQWQQQNPGGLQVSGQWQPPNPGQFGGAFGGGFGMSGGKPAQPDYTGLASAMGQRPAGMGQPMPPQPGGGLQSTPQAMSPQDQALRLLGGARRPQQTSPMGMQPRGQPWGPRPQQPRPPMPGQYDADRLP